jgi:hypothetical protein
MSTALPDTFAEFNRFSFLCLNGRGQFLRFATGSSDPAAAVPVPLDALPMFLKEKIVLRPGTTDVFVWLHGWQNDHARALATARRLFGNLDAAIRRPGSAAVATVPSFIAIHWPSLSLPTPKGYGTMRDRAAKMTEEGDAEFFVASLLGYLEARNQRAGRGGNLLRSAGGYYVHALGHSFGGRFLAAAIAAAARPRARTLSLLGAVAPSQRKILSARTEKLFDFTVDTACFLQMAAPCASFSDELSVLVEWSPFRGPLAVTHSKYDWANCLWHQLADGERGIGCAGATEPADWIGRILLRKPGEAYTEAEFAQRIVNVDGSALYTKTGMRPEGAHSDFWYEETIHLILSLAMHARHR